MPAHRTAKHTPFRVPAISAAAWLDSRGGTFRRGDVRASDDATYPATEAVRAAITAEYDGDIGTLRDLGQRFTGANGERYPSWRMRDIAELIGVDTRNRGAVDAAIKPAQFNRQRPLPPRPPAPEPEPEPVADIEPPESLESLESLESEATMPEPILTPEPASVASVAAAASAPSAVKLTATKEQKERVYPTREAICPGCGVTFTSTYYGSSYGSSGWTKYHSPGCGGAHRRRVKAEAEAAQTAQAFEKPAEKPAESDPSPPEESTAYSTPLYSGAEIEQGWGVTMWRSPRRQLRQSLHLMVDALPEGDTWTRAERSRWLEMLVGVLDFTISATPASASLADELLNWRVAQ